MRDQCDIRAIILRKSRCYMIKPSAHSRQYDFKLRGTRQFKEIPPAWRNNFND